jgi:hypothetical protein
MNPTVSFETVGNIYIYWLAAFGKFLEPVGGKENSKLAVKDFSRRVQKNVKDVLTGILPLQMNGGKVVNFCKLIAIVQLPHLAGYWKIGHEIVIVYYPGHSYPMTTSCYNNKCLHQMLLETTKATFRRHFAAHFMRSAVCTKKLGSHFTRILQIIALRSYQLV